MADEKEKKAGAGFAEIPEFDLTAIGKSKEELGLEEKPVKSKEAGEPEGEAGAEQSDESEGDEGEEKPDESEESGKPEGDGGEEKPVESEGAGEQIPDEIYERGIRAGLSRADIAGFSDVQTLENIVSRLEAKSQPKGEEGDPKVEAQDPFDFGVASETFDDAVVGLLGKDGKVVKVLRDLHSQLQETRRSIQERDVRDFFITVDGAITRAAKRDALVASRVGVKAGSKLDVKTEGKFLRERQNVGKKVLDLAALKQKRGEQVDIEELVREVLDKGEGRKLLQERSKMLSPAKNRNSPPEEDRKERAIRAVKGFLK